MLTGLRIQQIALIESLELTFERGFTVLTGETGAGKSILLDALDAVLGGFQGSAGFRLLRTGCDFGQIEASFSLDSSIKSWLIDQELHIQDHDLLITRDWRRRDDRIVSRTRINGVVVNKDQIFSLRPLLIDLTVQGQTQKLSKPGQQRIWLDRFGGSLLEEAKAKTFLAWNEWQKYFLLLEKAEDEFENSKLQSAQDEIFLKELELAELEDPAEDVKLEIEQDRLSNIDRLSSGLSLILRCLQGDNSEFPCLLDQLGVCIKELQALIKHDSQLEIARNKLFDLQANTQELIHEFEHYISSLNGDPERLNDLQIRLAFLKRLQRVYGKDLGALLKQKDQLKDSRNLSDLNDDLNRLRELEKEKRSVRDTHNAYLTKLRKKFASKLQDTLKECVGPMGLENIQFKVEINPSDPSQYGADRVLFLFSANPGQELSTLAEVASGGEMSRFLLAFKAIFSKSDRSATFLFDEIDVGVSGRVSSAITKLLKELASTHQVFCITHQPLVAAGADNHLRISKSIVDGKTLSQVAVLTAIEDRQKELAELAGGNFVEASVYAASLLDQQVA